MNKILLNNKPKDSSNEEFIKAWNNSSYTLEALYKTLYTLKEDISNIKKYDIQYKKGLGSISPTEWEEFFEMYSFQELLVTIYIRNPEDDNDGYIQDISMIEAWLDEDSDIRKEFIANYIEAVADNKDLRSLELQLLNEDGSEIPDPEFIEK